MSFVEQFLNTGVIFSTLVGKVAIGWGKRSWGDRPELSASAAFYFPDFFLESKTPWCHHEHTLEISIDELIQLLKNHPHVSDSFNAPRVWQRTPKEVFTKIFHALESDLQSGRLLKAVPYIFESSVYPINTLNLKKALLSILNALKNKPLFAYGFWDTQSGLLGATPELLFQKNGKDSCRLETMACAGTEQNNQENSSLLSAPKEQHEHHMVIRGLEESVASLGGSIIVHPTKILKLPLLSHLVTPISVDLKHPITFEQAVRALHPTPALGAFPRQAGLKWLQEMQKFLPRQRFGAPAGIIQAGGDYSTCIVAIRNAQWNSGRIEIGAGCGIVSGSQLESEWAELDLKIASIKNILDL